MFLKNNSDRGFTLIELAVVLVIVGIIVAFAVPSFWGLINRNRVNQALSDIVGAIKETQRQAMSRGISCQIDINVNTKILQGNPTGCLLRDRLIREEIEIRTNIPGASPNISFSHKGSTTKMGTIVVSNEYTDWQRCFVIGLGPGITRTGKYMGNSTGSVSATHCKRENEIN